MVGPRFLPWMNKVDMSKGRIRNHNPPCFCNKAHASPTLLTDRWLSTAPNVSPSSRAVATSWVAAGEHAPSTHTENLTILGTKTFKYLKNLEKSWLHDIDT